MTRISYIVGKGAEPGPTKGQSLPRGREEMFYRRGQKTVFVSDQTGNMSGFAGHTSPCSNFRLRPCREKASIGEM